MYLTLLTENVPHVFYLLLILSCLTQYLSNSLNVFFPQKFHYSHILFPVYYTFSIFYHLSFYLPSNQICTSSRNTAIKLWQFSFFFSVNKNIFSFTFLFFPFSLNATHILQQIFTPLFTLIPTHFYVSFVLQSKIESDFHACMSVFPDKLSISRIIKKSLLSCSGHSNLYRYKIAISIMPGVTDFKEQQKWQI